MKTNLCTAGCSYMHAYPNGDLYRCMKDYNTRCAPLASVAQFLKGEGLPSRPMPCRHKTCDVYCDSDWATKWLLEDGQVVQASPAKIWDGAIKKNPWAKARPCEAEDPSYMAVVWTPTLPCNYSCSYCGCAAGQKKILSAFPSSSPELDVAEWLSFFRKLSEQYTWGYLQTNGGEPLLSGATIPVLQLLSEKWAVNLVTNGSVEIMRLCRCRMKPFSESEDVGLSVTLSLHPTSKIFSWDAFLGKALLLHNEGYLRKINFVGWPGQLYLYEYYKDILDKYGIALALQPWMGTDNEGFSGYTEKEAAYAARFALESRNDHVVNLGAYAMAGDFAAELALDRPAEVEGDALRVRVRVKNQGTQTWENPDIQLGARLFPMTFGAMRAVSEHRCKVDPKLDPQQHVCVDLEIPLAAMAEAAGRLEVDMVYENRFWFAERGSEPIKFVLRKDAQTWKVSLAQAGD